MSFDINRPGELNTPARRRYDNLTLEEKVDEALSLLDSIIYAFPEGPSKHREMHQALIESKKAEAAFWTELKLDLVKKGTFTIAGIFLGLLFLGLSTRLGLFIKGL